MRSGSCRDQARWRKIPVDDSHLLRSQGKKENHLHQVTNLKSFFFGYKKLQKLVLIRKSWFHWQNGLIYIVAQKLLILKSHSWYASKVRALWSKHILRAELVCVYARAHVCSYVWIHVRICIKCMLRQTSSSGIVSWKPSSLTFETGSFSSTDLPT